MLAYFVLALINAYSNDVPLSIFFRNNLIILSFAAFLAGLLSKKYFFSPSTLKKKKAVNRILLFSLYNIILLQICRLIFAKDFYEQGFLFMFPAIIFLLDILFIHFYYEYAQSKKYIYANNIQEIDDKRNNADDEISRIPPSESEIIETVIGNNAYEWIRQYINFDDNKTIVNYGANRFSVKVLPDNSLNAIVNLQPINDFAQINAFFDEANRKLLNEAFLVGNAYTIEINDKRLINKYPFIVSKIMMFSRFTLNKIFAGTYFTKNPHSSYTGEYKKILSKAEVLGRLYAAGFELVDSIILNDRFFFYAKKVNQPVINSNQKYGSFIALRRVGINKKELLIYKLRTMYPYSEYIQKYVYDLNGTKDGDKATDDFRVTKSGHFMRKFWLDELPMIINLIKGDVKLVGVRPLSRVKFDTYPKELQEKRTMVKPGLIPPFYADLPDTQDEMFDSENKYLNSYQESPFKTDIKYFFKAFYNIILKNARSK